MDKYSSYKDSGVKWLGEIPSHWEMVRLRYLCRIKTGDKDTINRDENGKYPFYVRSPKVERINSYTYDGEAVLMAGDGVGAGKVFHYVNGKFGCHQRVYIINNIEKVNGKFLYYYMQSKFKYVIEQLSAKSTVDSVRLNMLQDFNVLIPSLKEQLSIIKYIEFSVYQIDTAISQQKKMIELLNERKQIIINNAVTKGLDPNVKMKDSGVDWIGEIPEGWEVRKAKLCVTISNGSDPKLEGDIPVYGSGSSSFRTCGEYKEGPCVLIGRKGATLHIPHYIEGRYWNVDTAFDVKAKDGILLKFYYYLATCFDYQFYMSQTTLPSMTSFDYNRMKLPLPPINEQKEILENLEKKLCFFNNAISSIEKQITLLQERKQIIINEVVTGKVKVS